MSIPCVSTVEGEAKSIVKGRIEDIYTSIKKYNENLKELKEACERLESKKGEVNHQIMLGEERLEFKTESAISWLEGVDELMKDKDVVELTNDDLRTAKDQCCCGMILCNGVYRYWKSKAAEEKARTIDKKIGEAPQPVTLALSAADMEPLPTEFSDGIKSRDELLERVLGKLLEDQVDALALCGMGAIGKTTLAKEAKKKVGDKFSLILMAEISEVPNVFNIQQQLAESIGLQLNTRNTDERAKELYNRLVSVKSDGSTDGKGGNILVILDNIWEGIRLSELGIPDEKVKECRVKILFTSRDKEVCRVMGVKDDDVIQVSLLEDREAKHLFRKQVGASVEDGDFKTVEDRLIRQCGGLPLAIVTAANALKGKDLSVWKRFADEVDNSNWSQLTGGLKHTNLVLETSFKLMENEKKFKFFLLACLFPPGTGAPIDDMVKYGIGLDLFQYVNNISEARNLAKTWVCELRSSSLLLDQILDEEFEIPDERYVHIHDVVRASALSFAAKGGQKMFVEAAPRWLCKDTLAEYTAISLTGCHNYSRLSGLNSDKLQLLVLRGNSRHPYETEHFDMDFFTGMTNLKVLVISGIGFGESIPESIGKLKNLKVLIMVDCQLGDIKCIVNLEDLLVLSLRGSEIESLPDESPKLCNIRLLDLGNCTQKTRMRCGLIASLSQLEGFYATGSDCQESTVS